MTTAIGPDHHVETEQKVTSLELISYETIAFHEAREELRETGSGRR